jgi:hypothetical protein
MHRYEKQNFVVDNLFEKQTMLIVEKNGEENKKCSEK